MPVVRIAISERFELLIFMKIPLCVLILAAACCTSHAQSNLGPQDVQIEVLFPQTAAAQPLTGCVFVALSRRPDDPARGMRSLGHQPIRANPGRPFFLSRR
jgi:hypothetical protein